MKHLGVKTISSPKSSLSPLEYGLMMAEKNLEGILQTSGPSFAAFLRFYSQSNPTVLKTLQQRRDQISALLAVLPAQEGTSEIAAAPLSHGDPPSDVVGCFQKFIGGINRLARASVDLRSKTIRNKIQPTVNEEIAGLIPRIQNLIDHLDRILGSLNASNSEPAFRQIEIKQTAIKPPRKPVEKKKEKKAEPKTEAAQFTHNLNCALTDAEGALATLFGSGESGLSELFQELAYLKDGILTSIHSTRVRLKDWTRILDDKFKANPALIEADLPQEKQTINQTKIGLDQFLESLHKINKTEAFFLLYYGERQGQIEDLTDPETLVERFSRIEYSLGHLVHLILPHKADNLKRCNPEPVVKVVIAKPKNVVPNPAIQPPTVSVKPKKIQASKPIVPKRIQPAEPDVKPPEPRSKILPGEYVPPPKPTVDPKKDLREIFDRTTPPHLISAPFKKYYPWYSDEDIYPIERTDANQAAFDRFFYEFKVRACKPDDLLVLIRRGQGVMPMVLKQGVLMLKNDPRAQTVNEDEDEDYLQKIL